MVYCQVLPRYKERLAVQAISERRSDTTSIGRGVPPTSSWLRWCTPMRSKELALCLAGIAFFALVSIEGSPFRPVYGNSGRYLLSVYRAIDPALFQDDPVAVSLERFSSAFYHLLAIALPAAEVTSDQLVAVMYALYIVSKVLLIVIVFAIARTLSRDIWLFVILAAWCCHPKSSPVGGESLFKPMLTHQEVVLVMGLAGVCFLLKNKHLYFWLILCLSVFFHSLMTFHLFLTVVPPMLLMHWTNKKARKENVVGIVLFAISTLLYLNTMAPPAMTAQESRIFWSAKGSMQHVSPFSPGAMAWLKIVSLVVLAGLAYRRFLRAHPKSLLLVGFVVSGSLSGVLLAFAAVFLESAQLALFQPLRVLLWVTFVSNLLLAMACVRALRESRPGGVVLLAVLILGILNSLWATGFTILAIIYFLAAEWQVATKWPTDERLETLAAVAILVTVGAMLLGWTIRHRLPLATLHEVPSIVCAVVLALIAASRLQPVRKMWKVSEGQRPDWPGASIGSRWRWGAVGCLMVYALISRSIDCHAYYARRVDPEWETVTRWCRLHTAKDAKFVTPPGVGFFRVRALRTSLNEPVSALAWVDPLVMLDQADCAREAAGAYQGKRRRLERLFSLATQWKARYVMLKGSYESDASPVFRTAKYSVFDARFSP